MAQWENAFLTPIFTCGSKKNLNIIVIFFSKVTNVSVNVGKYAVNDNGGKKPVYFCSGKRYLERSFAVDKRRLCASPI